MSDSMREKLEMLTRAGFRIGWADPKEAYERGWVSHDSVGPHAEYYRTDECRPFVEFDNTRGEDDYDQVPAWERSNHRSILSDYPNVFLPVSYSNLNTLGGFVHSMTVEHIAMMIGLAEHPVYDESDLSALESEEIDASWGQYLRADMDLGDEWEQVADLFTDAEFKRAFERAMWELEYWPDHNGLDVVWDLPYVNDVLAPRALSALVREHFGADFRSDPTLPLAV